MVGEGVRDDGRGSKTRWQREKDRWERELGKRHTGDGAGLVHETVHECKNASSELVESK